MAPQTGVSGEDVARIEVVFQGIKTAAMVLTAVEPKRWLAAWDRQEEMLPFTDPTLMQKLLAQRDDMRRKKRLLAAAAYYLQEWEAVRAEAHAAEVKSDAFDGAKP